jgi:hypothetical protein
MSDSKQSKQNDYSQGVEGASTYRYTQVQSNSFGQTITINTSNTPVVFNLPNEVHNSYNDYLIYNINIPAFATGYIWYRADVLPGVSHIQNYASNGNFMVDLDNLGNYMQNVLKKEVNLEDFKSYDNLSCLYPSNALANAIPNIDATSLAAPVATPNFATTNYDEPAKWQCGNYNSDVNIQVKFPMRLLKNTKYAIDKNLYHNMISYLKIYFGPLSKLGFNSTSNAGPSVGTNTEILTAVTVTNLVYQMALEDNISEKEKVMNAVRGGGISKYIPYVQAFKNSNNGSTQNINIQLENGLGSSVTKIYHSVYNNSETQATAYDNINAFDNAAISWVRYKPSLPSSTAGHYKT